MIMIMIMIMICTRNGALLPVYIEDHVTLNNYLEKIVALLLYMCYIYIKKYKCYVVCYRHSANKKSSIRDFTPKIIFTLLTQVSYRTIFGSKEQSTHYCNRAHKNQ